MPKGDMKDLVRNCLRSTGERMIELSKEIGDVGDRLPEHDKKLVRMALIPALEESFSELIHFYLLGEDEARSESFHNLDRILGLV